MDSAPSLGVAVIRRTAILALLALGFAQPAMAADKYAVVVTRKVRAARGNLYRAGCIFASDVVMHESTGHTLRQTFHVQRSVMIPARR